jgi:hypothetical protein
MKNIATALVKAQKAFAPALKNATNPHFRSKYVDLASCVDSVIGALNDNGIFLFQTRLIMQITSLYLVLSYYLRL